MIAQVDRCVLDHCQNVAGNWFMLIGGMIVIWLLWRYAP